MTRGLVRNEPLAQRERAVEYPSDSDYCALFQGAKEPRSQGAKKPEVRSTAFFCGASTRLPASDFLSPISWLLGFLAPLRVTRILLVFWWSNLARCEWTCSVVVLIDCVTH